MNADIGPGDWVVSIENMEGVPVGTLARVDGLHSDGSGRCGCGFIGAALVLAGVPLPGGYVGFCPAHWRPVYRPNAATMTEITRLVGAPLREPAFTD